MEHPHGIIGVIADLAGRYSQFYSCLSALDKPLDSEVRFRFGSDRSVSRNSLAAEALARRARWLLFLDDDHAFPPGLLHKLLQAEQAVVGSLYLQRTAPFYPIAYADKDDEGYLPLNLNGHGPDELVRVRSVGTGGMLINTGVFQEFEPPWFLHTTEQSEDMYFCDRLHEVGIPLYVHTGVPLGHIAPGVVYPYYDPEQGCWTAGFQFSKDSSMTIPLDYS